MTDSCRHRRRTATAISMWRVFGVALYSHAAPFQDAAVAENWLATWTEQAAKCGKVVKLRRLLPSAVTCRDATEIVGSSPPSACQAKVSAILGASPTKTRSKGQVARSMSASSVLNGCFRRTGMSRSQSALPPAAWLSTSWINVSTYGEVSSCLQRFTAAFAPDP